MLIRSVMLTLACMLICGCTTTATTATTATTVSSNLHEEVRARLDLMIHESMAGNGAGVAAVYADDGLLISPRGRVDGREAIDAYWTRFPAPTNWELTIDSLEGVEDVLHQRGRSTITMTRQGNERTMSVEFALIWIRDENGELRIAVDAYWMAGGGGPGTPPPAI